MTLEEFRELTATMPPTARIEIQIRQNIDHNGEPFELYEFRNTDIENVLYSLGRIVVQLNEDEPESAVTVDRSPHPQPQKE